MQEFLHAPFVTLILLRQLGRLKSEIVRLHKVLEDTQAGPGILGGFRVL